MEWLYDVWNRALTNAQITNLKNNRMFAPSGLVYSNVFTVNHIKTLKLINKSIANYTN